MTTTIRPTLTRTARPAAAVAAALTLAACGGPTPAAGNVHAGAADGEAIKIVTVDDDFQPATLELEPGTDVTIEVTNEGKRPHSLRIDEIALSTGTLESDDTVTATFTVPDQNTPYVCSFHPRMTGEIQVTTG